jgi:cephalosporin hydroxylase
MEHFYTNIHGWADGITSLYQQMVSSVPAPEMRFNGSGFSPVAVRPYHFVEVGAWKGKSAAFMAVEIINSGKDIKFDCIDTWEGSDIEPEHLADEDVKAGTLYEAFIDAMKPVEGHYTPIRATSVEAAALYEDGSLDFVFIDADHSYESVKADIAAWAPKVRPGGYLAGHDFNPATPNGGVERAVLEAYPDVTPLPWCWGRRM